MYVELLTLCYLHTLLYVELVEAKYNHILGVAYQQMHIGKLDTLKCIGSVDFCCRFVE